MVTEFNPDSEPVESLISSTGLESESTYCFVTVGEAARQTILTVVPLFGADFIMNSPPVNSALSLMPMRPRLFAVLDSMIYSTSIPTPSSLM
jgi:hypothetical protein